MKWLLGKIKLLFQMGFDDAGLNSCTPVIHANVYKTIKLLIDGSKELDVNETDSSKYLLSTDNKKIGDKLSEIGGRLDDPQLTKELYEEIEQLWKDLAIQIVILHLNCLKMLDVLALVRYRLT